MDVNIGRMNQEHAKAGELAQYLAVQLRDGQLSKDSANKLREEFYNDPGRPIPQVSVKEQLQQPRRGDPTSLLTCTDARDPRGQRIGRLNWRPDIIALQLAWSALMLFGFTLTTAVYVVGFIHLLYWQCSIAFAMLTLSSKAAALRNNSDAANASLLRTLQTRIVAEFKGKKVLNGSGLVSEKDDPRRAGTSLRDPTTNPSTRTSFTDQSNRLLADITSGKWRAASEAIAQELSEEKPVSIAKLQQILRNQKCALYSGSSTDYNSVHFCRSLIAAARQSSHGPRYAHDPSEWAALKSMGGGVCDGSRYFGLTTAKRAAETVRLLAESYNDPQYSYADLACFICMLDMK